MNFGEMNKRQIKKKTFVPAAVRIGGGMLSDIRFLIELARGRTASFVNTELTMLYWKVGERVKRDILNSFIFNSFPGMIYSNQ